MKIKIKKLFSFIIFWLKEILYLILGLALLSTLFYWRLIPRVSRDLWATMSYSQTVITLFTIILLIIHIYNLLKLLQYIPEKSYKYVATFKNLLCQLQKIVLELLYNFYLFFWNIMEIIAEKITKKKVLIHYPILRFLAQKINKKIHVKYYCWVLISIKFIPKIIFVMAFAIDVIIYQRLHYTFKLLPLLLLPLMETFIIFIFQEYCDINYAAASSFLEKKPLADSELMDYSFIAQYKETPPEFVKDFYDFFFNHYLVLMELRENLEFYAFWKTNVFPTYLVELLLLSIRLLLFLYILVHGLI